MECVHREVTTILKTLLTNLEIRTVTKHKTLIIL